MTILKLRNLFPDVDNWLCLRILQGRRPIYKFENGKPTFYIPADYENMFVFHEIGHFLHAPDIKIKNFGLDDLSFSDAFSYEKLAFNFSYSVEQHAFQECDRGKTSFVKILNKEENKYVEIYPDSSLIDSIFENLGFSSLENIKSEFADVMVRYITANMNK